MKTKKFLMTSLLVMGMIIAKAANGYPPELVLVSQPVLTYDYNSVTIYYDIQNIGDYTYRGDLYIYLDPDNGYCYATEYMRIGAGCIKRIAVSIPAYRPNPSVRYTVMPYYELYDELYSFTTFEYFEPIRFCWYGYRDEPWVVIHVGPRPRHYHRPSDYRFYYDGYYPMLPPPPAGGWGPGGPHGWAPMDPHHHTYNHHHSHGGYPANYYPEHETPGYNKPSEATVRPHSGSTPGSMSSNGASSNSGSNSGNSGATVRPSTNNSGATVRPSTNSNSGSSSSSSSRTPSSSSDSNATVRPSSNGSSSSGSSSSGRTGTSSSSSSTRTSSSSSSSSSNRSGTSSSSTSRSNDSSSNRSGSSTSSSSRSSSSSSSSRTSSSTGGRR